MGIVHDIIDAFDSQVALAKATGIPQQTINSWKQRASPEIPPWRRPAVLAAAIDAKINLPPEAIAYLASTERTPKRAQQAAAA